MTRIEPAAGTGTGGRGPLEALLGRTRAAVLAAVADGPCSTGELARRAGTSPASASEHAGVLRAADLVTTRRQGRSVRHLGEVLVHLGDGAGGFGTAEVLPGDMDGVGQTAVADVTGDGHLDVVRSGGDRLVVWARLPAGGLAAPVTTTGVGQATLATADLDGDGRTDVVAGTVGSGVADRFTPWLAAADGTFAAGTPVVVDHAAGAHRDPRLAAGDVDGDGDADVVASASGRLLTLLGDGAGGLAGPVATEPEGLVPGPIALGDLDADGVLDVAAADRRLGRTGVVVFGDGTGRFEDRLGVAMPPGAFATESLLVIDLVGDDRPDLVLPGYGVRIAPNALDGRTRP